MPTCRRSSTTWSIGRANSWNACKLPAGRQIAGFGPDGTIYLLAREGREIFLEKTPNVVN